MRHTLIVICSSFIYVGFFISVAHSQNSKIACGSSFLEELVRTVVGDDIEPYQLQPDSKDAKQYQPLSQESIIKLSETKLVLLQPVQRALKRELSQNNSGQFKVVVLKTRNMNVPLNYYKASEELKKILSKAYPQLDTYIEERFGELKGTISLLNSQAVAKGRELGFADIPCIVHQTQKAFATWIGFDVIGVFNDEEFMTEKSKIELVKKGKTRECWLIIGDQSAKNISVANYLVEALQGEGVLLSSQPDANSNISVPGWKTLLEENLRQIIDIVVWH